MNLFDKLKEKITAYVDLRINLLKINLIERTSGILAYVIYVIVIMFFLLAVLLFFGLGMSEAFSSLVNSRPLGYFMAFGVYFIIFILIIFSRRGIVRMFRNRFIGLMTEDDEPQNKNS
jgi:hypothetical protein